MARLEESNKPFHCLLITIGFSNINSFSRVTQNDNTLSEPNLFDMDKLLVGLETSET